MLDANAVLNLYRYSSTTTEDFLALLEALKSQLWLPHRPGKEFLENRVTVITTQIQKTTENERALSENPRRPRERARSSVSGVQMTLRWPCIVVAVLGFLLAGVTSAN